MTAEQLDYLLGLARALGRCQEQLDQAERLHDAARPTERRRTYAGLRAARKALDLAERELALGKRSVTGEAAS